MSSTLAVKSQATKKRDLNAHITIDNGLVLPESSEAKISKGKERSQVDAAPTTALLLARLGTAQAARPMRSDQSDETFVSDPIHWGMSVGCPAWQKSGLGVHPWMTWEPVNVLGFLADYRRACVRTLRQKMA